MPKKAAASAAKSVTKSVKKINKTYLLIALVAIVGIALFFWMNRAPAISPNPDYTSAVGATGASPAYTGAPDVEKNQLKEGTKLAGGGEFQYV